MLKRKPDFKSFIAECLWWVACVSALMVSCHSDAAPKETNDLRYMTEAIYFESQGEPDMCKMLVAKTINIRVQKKFWGDTVEDVVHQVSPKGTCQFSYYCDGKPEVMDYDSDAYKRSYEIANWALYNEDLPDRFFTSDHFINHNLSNKDWHKDMKFVMLCGGHSFYESDIK